MTNAYDTELIALRAARMSVANLPISADDKEALAILIALREIATPESNASSQTDPFDIPLTFAEWAGQYPIDSHADKFVCAAVYLWQNEGKRRITHGDIVELYRQARWPVPANPADVIGKAANKQLFTQKGEDGDGKKVWEITHTGFAHFKSLEEEIVNA